MHTTRSQRWRERRSRFVDNTTMIDPGRYSVDILEPASARAFIKAHHYLPTYPAAQLAVGLFGRRSSLAGVAVFAVPSIGAVVTRHTGFTDPAQGCVLARFVLLDDVAGNGETWFLSRALRHLRREKPKIEAVVSYSDPNFGHIGRIYAAMSSAHRGRTRPRTAYHIGGVSISGRTLSKIRLGERGGAGAVDQLVRYGASKPRPDEALPCWLHRLSHERILLRAQHPGLYTYCFELTRAARRAGRSLPRIAYPQGLDIPHPELPLLPR